MHRRQRQDGVLQAVAGQDDHGPIRRQVAIEKRLRNCARAPQGLEVGEVVPRAVSTAAGKKRPVWRVLRPVFEAVGDAGGVRPERDRTSSVEGAVAALVQHGRQGDDVGHGRTAKATMAGVTIRIA